MAPKPKKPKAKKPKAKAKKPKPKAKKPKAKAKPKVKQPKKSRKKEGPGYASRAVEWVLSWFRRSDPQTPIKGCGSRLKNAVICHFRGVLGILVPLCVLTWQGSKENPHITVQCMWLLMAWFFLIQPVSIPATSFIPIFLLPMTGIYSSGDTCQCYINENILLFVLTGMLILCLNNSGYDRRLALWFLCSGDSCQFAGKRMVFKCCTAGFFLSMISSRLIAASTILQYITKPLIDLQYQTSGARSTEPSYDTIRYILGSATTTSCAIGSIAIMHAAPSTLAFRTLFHESGTYPDVFNYLQYSAFAFPTAAIMNLVNIGYHMMLMTCTAKKKPMSIASMTFFRTAIMKYKQEIPRIMTKHELMTIFFVFFYLIIFFTRWCTWLKMGWADFSKKMYGGNDDVPGCMDATTAALFVIALHTIPKGSSFWVVLCENKKSKLPPLKRESTVLWWRFVDKNLNYAYMFLIGSGVAITAASKSSGLSLQILDNLGKTVLTNHSLNVGLLIVCFISVALANIMPGVAALVVFLPFIIAACGTQPVATTTTAASILRATEETPEVGVFVKNYYLCALAVGIGSSFGFMCPFMYTPAYFSHYTAKVPKLKMAKYSFGAAIICCIMLWVSLAFYAPLIWDPSKGGILEVAKPEDAVLTTKAAETTTVFKRLLRQ